MFKEAGPKKIESSEALIPEIKTGIERLLQGDNVFLEENRISRYFNLDSQALMDFTKLPVNSALISDVKMLLSISEADKFIVKLEHKDRLIENIIEEPQTISFQLNFRNKNIPNTTFIYFTHFRHGQPIRPYITQKNSQASKEIIGKATYRATVMSDLNAIRNLLKNQKD